MKELSKEPDWISEAGQCERPGLTFDPLFHVFVLSFLPSRQLVPLVRSLGSLRVLFHALIFISFLFYRFHAVSGAVVPSSPAHSRLGEYLGEINFESH